MSQIDFKNTVLWCVGGPCNGRLESSTCDRTMLRAIRGASGYLEYHHYDRSGDKWVYRGCEVPERFPELTVGGLIQELQKLPPDMRLTDDDGCSIYGVAVEKDQDGEYASLRR